MYNAEKMSAKLQKRFLGIDWGSRRIGVAISDPTGLISRPLDIISHISRSEDARQIYRYYIENFVDEVIMGVTYDENNQLTPSGRSAKRLADEIARLIDKPVILWDEMNSTLKANNLQIEKRVSRLKRRGHQDDLSATLILQDYLEKNNP
jgi:putative Holliday junction resolvase